MLRSTQHFGLVPCTASGAVQQRTSSEPLALPVMHVALVQHLGSAHGALLGKALKCLLLATVDDCSPICCTEGSFQRDVGLSYRRPESSPPYSKRRFLLLASFGMLSASRWPISQIDAPSTV